MSHEGPGDKGEMERDYRDVELLVKRINEADTLEKAEDLLDELLDKYIYLVEIIEDIRAISLRGEEIKWDKWIEQADGLKEQLPELLDAVVMLIRKIEDFRKRQRS